MKNLRERIEEVGGWETPEGFITFGSPMAVKALLYNFAKDSDLTVSNPFTDIQVKALSERAFEQIQNMPDDEVNGDTWDRIFAGYVQKAEQKRCARIALNACLVPPDGGSPTWEETKLCEEISALIMKDV